MKDAKISAILILLVDKLCDRGSWCGETHIQKAVFFLKEVMNMKFDFNFLLYKYGPFSFELKDKLNNMLAEEYLQLESKLPCGPSYKRGEVGNLFDKYFDEIEDEYGEKIKSIVDKFGNMQVTDLERLATALYFIKENQIVSNSAIASKMHSIKPHIQSGEAQEAVVELKRILKGAKEI